MIPHNEQVDRQFSPVADAYLSSTVHAQGADLSTTADKLRGSGRVLDLGCGAGHLAFAVAPVVGAIVACDMSPQMLTVVAAEAQRRGLMNLTTQQGTAEKLPFADASFDAVCTRMSAHHWTDVARGLAEMRRVLKPNGKVIVIDIVGASSPLFDTHLQAIELLRDPSHVRDYSLKEWADQLTRAGFIVTGHHTWRLRIEFDKWVARMKTPADRVAMLHSLWQGAPREVRDHFQVAADSSFDLEAALIECHQA